MRTVKILLGVVATAALVGCAREASGPLETQIREVGTFTAIDTEGAVELKVTVGTAASVQVEAPADLLEELKTEVRGETLYIKSKPKDWLFKKGRSRPKVTIATPTLASLRLHGGHEVEIHGFAGGESQIKAEGAVDIEAEGELDRLTIRLAGASNGDFSRLLATHAHVTVEGVGSVVVHSTETLDATMNGVGSIKYTGTPREVSTRMNGLGRITRADGYESRRDEPAQDDNVEIDPDTLQPEYDNRVRDRARLEETEVI